MKFAVTAVPATVFWSGMSVTVGAAFGAASNAPMSAAAPATRRNPVPRWSVARARAFDPLSIAGLPLPRAWVKVGPPLSASGPSSGSTPVRLLPPVSVAPLASPIRLKLAVSLPLTSGPVAALLVAMMVLSAVAVVPASRFSPPPLAAAVLFANVELSRSTTPPSLSRPPPSTLAVFPETVLLRTAIVPAARR